MLQFEWKSMNQLQFEIKYHVEQNNAIWVEIYEKAWMLKFNNKIGNRSKCWNFSAQYVKSIKMLKFECKISNRSNLSDKVWNGKKVEICGQNFKSIKVLKFDCKMSN